MTSGRLTLILPPGCQRIWAVDPTYLWATYSPTTILMDEEDFLDSEARARNSPYDHKLHRGFATLRKSRLLSLYSKRRALGRGWERPADDQTSSILRKARSQGDAFFHSLGRHVWADYVRYLDAKKAFFPFYPHDPFYNEVWTALLEDRQKTAAYAQVFDAGGWPPEADIEFILGELIRRTIIAFSLTRYYRRAYPHAFFYNTWEYRPIVELVAQELGVEAEQWAKLQDEEMTNAWACLTEAFAELDARYRGRGVYHFIRSTAQVGLLRIVSEELRILWERYDGNVTWITDQIRSDVQRTIDLTQQRRVTDAVSRIRGLAEDAAAVSASTTGIPFNILGDLIRRLDRLRLKEGIQAYAFLFLLKQDRPILGLPDLLPPFGPGDEEGRSEAIARMQARRWLKWDSTGPSENPYQESGRGGDGRNNANKEKSASEGESGGESE